MHNMEGARPVHSEGSIGWEGIHPAEIWEEKVRGHIHVAIPAAQLKNICIRAASTKREREIVVTNVKNISTALEILSNWIHTHLMQFLEHEPYNEEQGALCVSLDFCFSCAQMGSWLSPSLYPCPSHVLSLVPYLCHVPFPGLYPCIKDGKNNINPLTKWWL